MPLPLIVIFSMMLAYVAALKRDIAGNCKDNPRPAFKCVHYATPSDAGVVSVPKEGK